MFGTQVIIWFISNRKEDTRPVTIAAKYCRHLSVLDTVIPRETIAIHRPGCWHSVQ